MPLLLRRSVLYSHGVSREDQVTNTLRRWCEDGCILQPDGSWLVQALPDDKGKVYVYRVVDAAAKDRLVVRIVMQCRILQFTDDLVKIVPLLVFPWYFVLWLFGVFSTQFSGSLLFALSPLLILLAVRILRVAQLNWRSWFFDRLGKAGSRIDPAAAPVQLLVRDAATWRAVTWTCRPAILRAIPWVFAWGLAIGSAGGIGIAFAACAPWAWVSPTAFGLQDLGLCREMRVGEIPIWFVAVLATMPVTFAFQIRDCARYAAAGALPKFGSWRAPGKSA